ncbi:hypothetical protein [Streptomyces meridianus]|uniref:Integral membrane protein n=1 Tax=Streptomyces meridianus TaxID=2938945 RepID=A0ABT0X1Y4_9ACTN|nr:hypothetical protein [Streptomyces meridianus]MCM2576479.1 hypothetical protein [Streptomyces meridianus]
MDISAGRLRALRAALFTALCVTLSAASHVLLSGAPLPPVTVGGLAAGVFLIAYALAGRERSFRSIAALLVPLELAADTVFTTGQHLCYGEAGGPVAGPLRSLGLDVLCTGGHVGAPLARITGGETGAPVALPAGPSTPWLLLAAHVAVGLAAAAWLRRGEAALGGLVCAVAGAAFRPLLTAVAAVGASPAGPGREPRPRPAAPTTRIPPILVHSVVRRGPPCPSF